MAGRPSILSCKFAYPDTFLARGGRRGARLQSCVENANGNFFMSSETAAENATRVENGVAGPVADRGQPPTPLAMLATSKKPRMLVAQRQGECGALAGF